MKKGILSILVWALLTTGAVYATVSSAPTTPEQLPDPGMLASALVTSEPRTPAIEASIDSPVIREAHSDGGYWYWSP